MVGLAMARRLRISATACASERSLFRNFSRAGVEANRSVTSIRVPGGAEAGRTGPFTPASTTMADPVAASARPGGDRQPRHRPDGGQRLAAKAEGRDGEQVAVRELRGGMPLDREFQIPGAHAASVVDDPDQPAAARLDGDLDGAGAGIDRVLDQFLDGRRRTLDHLARSDAVDEDGIEAADVAHGLIDLAGIARTRRIAPGSRPMWGGCRSRATRRADRSPVFRPWLSGRMRARLLSGFRQILLGQDLALLDRRLIEGVDPERVAGEDRFQHRVHEKFADRALVQAARYAWCGSGGRSSASVSAVARPCAATRSPMRLPAKPGSPARLASFSSMTGPSPATPVVITVKSLSFGPAR